MSPPVVVVVESPVVEVGSPVVEVGSPVVEVGSPVVEVGSPVVEVGSPVVDVGSPVVEVGSPVVVVGSVPPSIVPPSPPDEPVPLPSVASLVSPVSEPAPLESKLQANNKVAKVKQAKRMGGDCLPTVGGGSIARVPERKWGTQHHCCAPRVR